MGKVALTVKSTTYDPVFRVLSIFSKLTLVQVSAFIGPLVTTHVSSGEFCMKSAGVVCSQCPKIPGLLKLTLSSSRKTLRGLSTSAPFVNELPLRYSNGW